MCVYVLTYMLTLLSYTFFSNVIIFVHAPSDLFIIYIFSCCLYCLWYFSGGGVCAEGWVGVFTFWCSDLFVVYLCTFANITVDIYVVNTSKHLNMDCNRYQTGNIMHPLLEASQIYSRLSTCTCNHMHHIHFKTYQQFNKLTQSCK